ncbi:MAG: caspase family protein [Spirochaetaceae bacterium]|nr:caspase family protein [Spirochaetaceae bacterium]
MHKNLTRLNNPVNNANDMTTVLKELGFTVDTLLNTSRVQMEEAIERFRNWLSVSKNSYSFLFYAGHGVQSGSVNYLMPMDADMQQAIVLPCAILRPLHRRLRPSTTTKRAALIPLL